MEAHLTVQVREHLEQDRNRIVRSGSEIGRSDRRSESGAPGPLRRSRRRSEDFFETHPLPTDSCRHRLVNPRVFFLSRFSLLRQPLPKIGGKTLKQKSILKEKQQCGSETTASKQWLPFRLYIYNLFPKKIYNNNYYYNYYDVSLELCSEGRGLVRRSLRRCLCVGFWNLESLLPFKVYSLGRSKKGTIVNRGNLSSFCLDSLHLSLLI